MSIFVKTVLGIYQNRLGRRGHHCPLLSSKGALKIKCFLPIGSGLWGQLVEVSEHMLAARPFFLLLVTPPTLTLFCLSHRWAHWPGAVLGPRRNEPRRKYFSSPGAPLGGGVWGLTQKLKAWHWPLDFGTVPEATILWPVFGSLSPGADHWAPPLSLQWLSALTTRHLLLSSRARVSSMSSSLLHILLSFSFGYLTGFPWSRICLGSAAQCVRQWALSGLGSMGCVYFRCYRGPQVLKSMPGMGLEIA